MATQDGQDIMRLSHSAQQIDDFIASKGTADGVASLDGDGCVPLSQMHSSVIERMVTVADDTARFALTTADVQDGDSVLVLANSLGTNIMYIVKDEANLDSETGYQVYTAATASQALRLAQTHNIGGAPFNGEADCTPLASGVSYSNTSSELSATSLQGAVDELAARPSAPKIAYGVISKASGVSTMTIDYSSAGFTSPPTVLFSFAGSTTNMLDVLFSHTVTTKTNVNCAITLACLDDDTWRYGANCYSCVVSWIAIGT